MSNKRRNDGTPLLELFVVAAVVAGTTRRMPMIPLAGVSWEWLLTPVLVAIAAILLGRTQLLSEAIRTFQMATPLSLALLADAVWTTTTIIWSVDRCRSVLEIGRTLTTTAAALVFAAALRDGIARRRVLRWVLLAGGLLSVAGIVAALLKLLGYDVGGIDQETHAALGAWPRATAGIGSPAVFGTTTVALVVLTFAGEASGALSARSIRMVRWLAVMACLVSASIPSLAAATLVVSWALAPTDRRLALGVALLVAAIGTTIIYVHVHVVEIGHYHMERAPEPGYSPLGYSMHPLWTLNIAGVSIVGHETGYWAFHRVHFRVLAAHPMGVGAGAFEALDIGPILRSTGSWYTRGRPHGWLFARFSEGGVIGGLIAICVTGAMLMTIRAAYLRAEGVGRGAIEALSGALIASLLFGEVHQWCLAFAIAGVATGFNIDSVGNGGMWREIRSKRPE